MWRAIIFSLLVTVPLSVWFTLVDVRWPSESRLMVPLVVACLLAAVLSPGRRGLRAVGAGLLAFIFVSLLALAYFYLGGVLVVGTAYAGGLDASNQEPLDLDAAPPPRRILLLGQGYGPGDAGKIKDLLDTGDRGFQAIAPSGSGDLLGDSLITLREYWGFRASPAHNSLATFVRQPAAAGLKQPLQLQTFGVNQGALVLANYQNRWQAPLSIKMPTITSFNFSQQVPDVRDDYTQTLLQSEIGSAAQMQLACASVMLMPGIPLLDALGIGATAVSEYGSPKSVADFAGRVGDVLSLSGIGGDLLTGSWGSAAFGAATFGTGRILSAATPDRYAPVWRRDIVPIRSLSSESFGGLAFQRSVAGTTEVVQVLVPPQARWSGYMDGTSVKIVKQDITIRTQVGPLPSYTSPTTLPGQGINPSSPGTGTLPKMPSPMAPPPALPKTTSPYLPGPLSPMPKFTNPPSVLR